MNVTSQIFEPAYSDLETRSIFSDEALIARMLQVECALAQVQSRLRIIPRDAAAAIEAAADHFEPDYEGLSAGAERDGFPVTALLAQLRERIEPAHAGFLHWGATTQDVIDTSVVLQVRVALKRAEALIEPLGARLVEMADAHRGSVMPARTHAQQALPTTFGLKAAGWLAPLLRHLDRLAELRERILVVQFGGAAGTLAALGSRGVEVAAGLASELGLGIPELPWHNQRDRVAETAGWLSLVTGSLAKMAGDVILMSQSEIGEVRESAEIGRGGSSTMPQKRNPIVSERIRAAARINSTLLSAVHQAQVQEHERGTHGLQVELLTLPRMFALTNGALANAYWLANHMVVDVEAMRRNVEAADGLIVAEALVFSLAGEMGRVEAKRIVGEACRTTMETGRHLVDVVRERTGSDLDWEALKDEKNYLGSADAFIDAILEKARSRA
jgi:3-carboxy-cis,cis-muconate cycloisomerase